MSFLGRLVYHTPTTIGDSRTILERLLNLFAPNLVIAAWARQYEAPPWNESGRIPFDPDVDDEEWLSFGWLWLDRKEPRVFLDSVPYHETITASLGISRRAEEFYQALNAEIPAEVRGDFEPWKPVVTVGPHDIFDGDIEGLIRVAHAQVSVTMQCQRIAVNIAKYERMVFTTKASKKLQADLEEICGPLQTWIGWDY